MSYFLYFFALLLGYISGMTTVFATQWLIRHLRGTTRLAAYYPEVRRECEHIAPRVTRKGDMPTEEEVVYEE